jgi:hypothetical protein
MLMAPSIGIKITNFTALMVQLVEYPDGTKCWYLEGKEMTEAKF